MAAAQLSRTGRGGLGAAGSDGAAWRLALARWEKAEAALAREMGRTACGSFEEETAREEVFGRLLGARNEALRRLLRAPAPDFAALAAKIALTIEHEVATLSGGGGAASPPSSPTRGASPPGRAADL